MHRLCFEVEEEQGESILSRWIEQEDDEVYFEEILTPVIFLCYYFFRNMKYFEDDYRKRWTVGSRLEISRSEDVEEDDWIAGRVCAVHRETDELEIIEDLVEKVSKRMVAVISGKSLTIRRANKQNIVK